MSGSASQSAPSADASQAARGAGPDPSQPVPADGRGWRLPKAGDLLYRYSVLVALLVEIAIFSALQPDSFFTLNNAQSILGSQAVLLMVAIGLTVPLATNEFDLSIGSMVGLSQIIVATLTVNHGWPLLPAVVATLAVAAFVGLVNAILVVRVGVSAFITTLGMGTLLLGFAVKITNSETIGDIPTALSNIAGHHFLGLQLVFWYGTLATAILWYVLRHTPVGRWLYFTGANPEAARLNGVPVGLVRGGALITSAVVAAIAGILYAGVFGTADPNSGDQFLLPAFAAAFLGATALTPGRFNAWGTFLSVYLVITGIVGLTLVTSEVGWITFVFNGTVLIVAVASQRIVATRRERARDGAS